MNKDKSSQKLTSINTLTLIQNELDAPKNHKGPGGKYQYRSCEDILTALKPLLKKYNAQLSIYDEVLEINDIVYIESTCIIIVDGIQTSVNAQAGIDLSSTFMSLPQKFGSASSYARKYALSGLFLIDDEDSKDPDGIPKSIKEKPQKQTNKTQTPETLKQLITSTMNHFATAIKNNKIPEKQQQKFDEYMASIDIETDMKKMRGVRTALKKLING